MARAASTADIYELHAKAFPHITASVILFKGERVATFATKYVGQSNPNGVTCWGYLHVLGVEMARGKTGPGGGYAMKDAAFAAAADRLKLMPPNIDSEATRRRAVNALIQVCKAYPDGGQHWQDHMREAGFVIVEAL